MTRRTDVLVVGGGATGAAVARDLTMRGLDVTLVDRGGLGSGTSTRSHGLLHSGARYADSDPEGAVECREERRVLESIAGECVRDTGGLFLQLEDDDPDYFDRKLAACEEHGIDATELDAAAVRELVPDVADDVVRGMRVPDGVVYPSRLVAATAADARERGAEVLPRAPVEDLRVEAGRVVGATLGGEADGRRVEADFVVNATGAWAGRVASLAGVDVEMRPTKGAMVAVDYAGLGPVLNRCRPPADGDIVVPHDSVAVLGTTSVAVDDPDEFDEESWEVEALISECSRMLPPAADAEVTGTYWGVRPLYAPDESDRGTTDSGTGDQRAISRGFFLLDHAADGAAGFASVVGGKLTTHRRMAAATADRVCEELGVDAACRTAEEPLVGAADPDRLDGFVAEFDAGGPADADVVARPDR